MTAKKIVLVGAGVLTALVVASPMALATEGHEAPAPGKVCAFQGGDAGAESVISGDSGANAVAQAPVGGNNALNVGNCSDFLNNNGNGNLSGNNVEVLSPELPELPIELPPPGELPAPPAGELPTPPIG